MAAAVVPRRPRSRRADRARDAAAEVLRDGGIAAERFAAPIEHGVEPGTGLVGGDPLRDQGRLELGRRGGRDGRGGDPFDLEPVDVGRRRRSDLGCLPGRLCGISVVEPVFTPRPASPHSPNAAGRSMTSSFVRTLSLENMNPVR
ncbi:MAG: hypothetical protein V9G12_20530 [Microthrixaceae bacterium]